MQNFKYGIIMAVTVIASYGMAGCGGKQTQKIKQEVPKAFALPEVPKVLTSHEDVVAFMALHFWDLLDFADTTLSRRSDFIEQAFVGFVDVLKQLPVDQTASPIKRMLDKTSVADSMVFACFTDLAEKYFYNPNSPYRNEEYYIPVLEYILAHPRVGELDKTRPRYQLEMALKNRPGQTATNFTFTTREGKKIRLQDVKAKYTILYFNNPDCHDCQRVKELLKQNITKTLCPDVKILAIYPDEDISLWRKAEYPQNWYNGYDQEQVFNCKQIYDLKAIPCLYLLDKDKKVILKDAPIEAIIHFLQQ